ncbi:hypothetical protein J2T07_000907 [Luteibacter jiangsuensis]|uniref:Uncharacterized protein n=1 Tax=Luteibacter jiangsuensis TaxID=637577 RepID=A0ABT9SUS3_9GAMM|nr:hypothetical protein [Luteibacter jiangsuensis]MDQ0008748.1 hypothetical protein [Luteibacter jiangsuensis]
MSLRAELERLCKASPEWDGRVCALQVVDANDKAMQRRALVSSPNSGKSWDLRCKVREGLIDYVRREFPDFLPRVRGEVVSDVRMADAGTPVLGHRMTSTRRWMPMGYRDKRCPLGAC